MGVLDTVEGLMSGIYDYCGNPSEGVLSPSAVLTFMLDSMQQFRNEQDLTDEGWRLEPYDLTVSADKEEYLIADPSFGRPFFVETIDLNNPHFRRSKVELARFQDFALYTPTWSGAASVSQSAKHSARVFLFRDIGTPTPYAKVLPLPGQTATYRIWHESIIDSDVALTDVPQFLQNFFPLVKSDAACMALGLCNYSDSKFNQIYGALDARRARNYDTFQNYIQQIFHADTGDMLAANSSRRGNRNRRGSR